MKTKTMPVSVGIRTVISDFRSRRKVPKLQKIEKKLKKMGATPEKKSTNL